MKYNNSSSLFGLNLFTYNEYIEYNAKLNIINIDNPTLKLSSIIAVAKIDIIDIANSVPLNILLLFSLS